MVSNISSGIEILLFRQMRRVPLAMAFVLAIAGCNGCVSRPMSPELLALSAELRETPRVAAGYGFVLAVKDGKVYGWGTNGDVLIDKDGAAPSLDRPVIIPIPDYVVSVSAGMEHAVALTKGGDIWTWGSNLYGAMGVVQFKDKRPSWASSEWNFKPFKISGLPKIHKISAGGAHTLALANDGRVWAWGSSVGTRIPGTNRTKIETPQPVNGLPRAKAVYAGLSASFVMTQDRQVYVWGSNANNILAIGMVPENLISNPQKSTIYCDVANIDSETSTIFLCESGNLYVIGGNTYGVLGLGDNNARESLTPGPDIGHVLEITGGDRRLALINNGTVMGWGHDAYGVVEFSNSYQSVPKKINFSYPVIYISSHSFNAYLVTSNGGVFRWLSGKSWFFDRLYHFFKGYKFEQLKNRDGTDFNLFDSKKGE